MRDCQEKQGSPLEFGLLRSEYAVLLLLTVCVVIYNAPTIDWVDFVLMFALIDVIGFLPGYFWCKFNGQEIPPAGFYRAYNLSHHLSFALIVSAGYWFWINNNWAFLALFMHQFGDRAVLGNFHKNINNPFNQSTLHLLRE